MPPQSENLFDIVTFLINQTKNFAPTWVHGAFQIAIIFESENGKYTGLFTHSVRSSGTLAFIEMMRDGDDVYRCA